jgi:hypothetical protein
MASRLAEMVLSNVTREYPNKMDHVMIDATYVKGPRALHPVFYGSFDWHSCVHSYWLLARVCRRFPTVPISATIRCVIDQHLTMSNVAGELDYLASTAPRSFERPYGIAWLLMLAAELAQHTSDEGPLWFDVLSPLTTECASRLRNHIETADYPVRAGIHSNSAFALVLGLDYASFCCDDEMGEVLRCKCRSWFENDADCPVWEPDGEDFLSSAFIKVMCIFRVLVLV